MTLNPKSLLEVFLILNVDKQMIENVCEGGLYTRQRNVWIPPNEGPQSETLWPEAQDPDDPKPQDPVRSHHQQRRINKSTAPRSSRWQEPLQRQAWFEKWSRSTKHALYLVLAVSAAIVNLGTPQWGDPISATHCSALKLQEYQMVCEGCVQIKLGLWSSVVFRFCQMCQFIIY